MPVSLPNYVKFLRGTPTAYSNLKASGGLSNDTLYFISDKGEDVTSGKLYLGAKLISGSGEGGGVDNLSELKDILLGTLANNQVLVYDNTAKKWKNVSIATLIEQFNNITFDTHEFETVSGDVTLKGFTAAPVGTLLSKGANGDITWVQPVDLTAINTSISNLQTTIGNMYTNSEIDSLIASANYIRREIATDLNAITNPVDNTVYMVRNGNPVGNLYDEFMYLNGNFEPIGNGSINLSNYVQFDDLDDYVLISRYESEVGDLTQLLKASASSTLVDQVNVLTQHLTWQEMDDVE